MKSRTSQRRGPTAAPGAGRLIRGLAALMVLVGLVVGVPWMILSWGAWTDLAAIALQPSRLWLPDDGHLVMAVLTVVGTVAWLVLMVSLSAEVVGFGRSAWRRSRPTVTPASPAGRPGALRRPSAPVGWLKWPRQLVRPLVLAVFALAMAAPTVPAMAQTIVEPAVTQTTVVPAPTAADSDSQPGGENHPGEALTDPTPPGPGGAVSDGQYVVQPGDSLWSIAQAVYGQGPAWVNIAQANASLLRASPDLIEVGWVLVLPPVDTVTGQPTATTSDTVVTVVPGDSLWSIAATALGSGQRWPEIADLNTDVIQHPDLIQPGWRLTLPPIDADSSKPAGDDPADAGSGDDRTTAQPDQPDPADPTNLAGPTDQANQTDQGDQAGGNAETTPVDLTGVGDLSNNSMSGPAGPTEFPAGPVVIGLADPADAPPGDAVDLPVGAAADPGPSVPTDIVRTDHSAAVAEAVGGLGLLLAGGLVLTLRRRRQAQLRARPVGRRLPSATQDGSRLQTALGLVGDMEAVESADLAVGHATEVVPVVLGRDDDGRPVVEDLEALSTLTVAADASDDLRRAMDALCLGLAAGLRAEVDVQVVTTDPSLFSDFETVTCYRDPQVAVDHLKTLVSRRRNGLDGRPIDLVRQDVDLAEAYRPVVFCFVDPVSAEIARSVSDTLTLPSVGVSAVVGALIEGTSPALDHSRLAIDPMRRARLYPSGLVLTPSLLDQHEIMSDLLAVAASLDTVPAWWSTSARSGLPPSPAKEMTMMPPPATETAVSGVAGFHHPTIMLLGPMTLEGARGPQPTRAERSCIEYCCWLLEHPGASAAAMAQSLLVAESTRRSNMSRLRTWLGEDQTGRNYLPEAYSGRIWLHEAVTSDWQRLCWMIGGGIEALEADRLLDVLRLVRGMPLADAAPGQWHWAEELRTDMVSVIRDVGIVAARKCLDAGRIAQARWAINRALLAAPDDETLLVTRIEVEVAAGNWMEVERLAGWVTRNARTIGIDLLPESAAILREVWAKPRPTRSLNFGPPPPPQSPAGQPQFLAGQSQSPADQPQSLADQPQSLAGQPQSLAGQPQSLADQPQSPADRPPPAPPSQPSETLVDSPVSVPPVGWPAGPPAGPPAGSPAGSPADSPAGSPVSSPVGWPADRPVGSVTDPPVGPQTSLAINAPAHLLDDPPVDPPGDRSSAPSSALPVMSSSEPVAPVSPDLTSAPSPARLFLPPLTLPVSAPPDLGIAASTDLTAAVIEFGQLGQSAGLVDIDQSAALMDVGQSAGWVEVGQVEQSAAGELGRLN